MEIKQAPCFRGSRWGSCFTDCIATICNSYGEDYELMALGALVFTYSTATDIRRKTGDVVFGSSAKENLESFHNIVVCEEQSLKELMKSFGMYKFVIAEISAYCCPWDKNYGHKDHRGTHCFICGGFQNDRFVCVDPYYNLTGTITVDQVAEGYCRHFRAEHKNGEKIILECKELIEDIQESAKSFSSFRMKLVKQLNTALEHQDYIWASNTAYLFSNRLKQYCILLQYCQKQPRFLRFKPSLSAYIDRLIGLSFNWQFFRKKTLTDIELPKKQQCVKNVFQEFIDLVSITETNLFEFTKKMQENNDHQSQ